MTYVWKFVLRDIDEQDVEMPAGAQLLHAGLDPTGTVCVWARVDPAKPRQARRIRIARTGNPLGDVGAHVGSFVDGRLVLHVFDGATP